MVLIGLAGKINSGKSTIAEYLVLKYDFIEMTYAKPLKNICQELFCLTDDQLYTQKGKMEPDSRWYDCTPRTMMQFIGTDLFRNNLDKIMPGLCDNVFIENMRIRLQQESHHNIVVSDIRFQNEADLIISLGGIIYYVDRDNNSNDSHVSEQMNFDKSNMTIIKNNSTIDDLCQQFDDIIKNL